MAYSEVSDLLLEDIELGLAVNTQRFVDLAFEEIDSKIGWRYKLPLEATDGGGDWETLPRHQMLLLKGINNKLASGELILSLDIAEEKPSLHAYGLYLVQQARAELMLLANGDVVLDAVPYAPATEDIPDRTPGITNEDSESLTLAFEHSVMGRDNFPTPWFARPGQVS